MIRHALLRFFLSIAFFVILLLGGINFYKESLVHYLANGLDSSLKIQGVSGFFPFDLSFKKVEIGTHLTLHDVEIMPSLRTFFTGKVVVDDISVHRIQIHPFVKSAQDNNVPVMKNTENAVLQPFPNFAFLEKFTVHHFSTDNIDVKSAAPHSAQNLSGTFSGKVEKGILHADYQMKINGEDYKGTLEATPHHVTFNMDAQGKNGALKLDFASPEKISYALTYDTYHITGDVHHRTSFYAVMLRYGEIAQCVFEMKDFDAITVRSFAYTLKDGHPISLKKPVMVMLAWPITSFEIVLEVLGENLGIKDLSVGDALSGKIFMKTGDALWKNLDPTLEIEGGVLLEAFLGGSWKNPTCEGKITSQKIKHKKISPLKIQKGEVHFAYAHQKGTFALHIEGKNALLIKGKGTLEKAHNGAPVIDFDANFHFYLRNLLKILPRFDKIDGELQGHLKVQGPLMNPKVNGSLSLDRGYFENYIIGTHIQNLSGKVTLKDSRAVVNVVGRDDFKGRAKITGDISLFPLKGSIKAHLHRFYLGQSDLFTACVTGAATVDLASKKIVGLLHAHQVVVDLDQLTPSATPKITLVEKTPIATHDSVDDHSVDTTENPFFFNLTLQSDKDIIVRGFGIHSRWEGSMKLYGTRPDFVGEFTLLRGTIDILDKISNLSRGKILFDHAIDEPFLDIDLRKKVQEFDILINLRGRANSPQFSFVSSPTLSQEEILALILLGRKSAAGSIGQLVELSSSLSGLQQQGQENFFTKFRKTFGIEALEIKKIEQDGGSNSSQAVSVRKPLSDRFTLVVEQALTAEDKKSKATSASIEANITDNLNVEVDVSSNKSGGVGLNWVKRY